MAPKASQLFHFILLLCLLLPLVSHAKLEEDQIGEKSSPFEFLKHLPGCHKGNHVKGLLDLKTYLEKFGYLKYHQNDIHAHDDDFDDLLEAAIKTYQLNYHLKATGNLDPQTVNMMVSPRCGVPDIINGTNSMRAGKKRHQRQNVTDAFHAVSHYSFFRGNPRWPASKFHLTYAFLPGTHNNAMNSVARAFNKWASATHFRFSRIGDYRNADLTISFHRLDHGDGYPFDGRGGTLAHAWAPTDGRFHYDSDELWSVGPRAGAFDLETVALHEIGHLLGLGHSSVQNAIMYPSIPAGTAKGLHGDDIQGIRVLYGN